MAWQSTVKTGRVIQLAYAVESVAAPGTLPGIGSSLDWTAIASGENCNGWTANTWEMTEDDLDWTDQEPELVIVKPPGLRKQVAALTNDSDSPTGLILNSYEVGAAIYGWATNATLASATYTKSGTWTRKALCVEVEGVGLHYMPSVEIGVGTVGGSAGGRKNITHQRVYFRIFGTSAKPDGYDWSDYT